MKKVKIIFLIFFLFLSIKISAEENVSKIKNQKKSCLPLSKTLTISGNTFVFGPPAGGIKDTEVSVLEYPEIKTKTDDSGAFSLNGIMPCSEVTLILKSADFHSVQTGTFYVENKNLSQVSFQTPANNIYKMLVQMLKITEDENSCHIATTVTRKNASLYTSDINHGQEGATVTISPKLKNNKPIYFNYINQYLVLPDYKLKQTTLDGGVLFVNVPPAEYILTAHQKGFKFSKVKIKCRAGMFVNASPPNGLQAQ